MGLVSAVRGQCPAPVLVLLLALFLGGLRQHLLLPIATTTSTTTSITGRIVGPDPSIAHRIWSMSSPSNGAGHAKALAEPFDVVVVGGGIAGLAAAWWLTHGGNDSKYGNTKPRRLRIAGGPHWLVRAYLTRVAC